MNIRHLRIQNFLLGLFAVSVVAGVVTIVVGIVRALL